MEALREKVHIINTAIMVALFLAITLLAVSSSVAFVTPPSHCNHAAYRTINKDVVVQIMHPTTTSTQLHLFGNLFAKEKEDLLENELARFSHLVSSNENPTTKFDSLSNMISSWSKVFFTDDGKKKTGLTTPVTLVELKPSSSQIEEEEGGSDEDGEIVTNYSGVQLLFKKGKTGGRAAYQDKDDENKEGAAKKKEDTTIKEGGVEVRVEQLSNGDLQVIAKRCDFDDDTMIKEMSEQTIIESLKKAMAAWKKDQSFQ